jgi:hypothetical protein
MSYMYGLFDNDDDVRTALNALERLGKGKEVVEVIIQPEETPVGSRGDGPLIDTPLIPVADVIPAATTAPEGMIDVSTRSSRLDGLGEIGDYFWRAVGKGAQIVVVDTSDAEVVASLFKEANAQRVYDKRAGRDV